MKHYRYRGRLYREDLWRLEGRLYQATVLRQTDPEEPEFSFAYLGDPAKQRTDYDPAWDYENTTQEDIEYFGYLLSDLEHAYREVVQAAASLRLPEPIVYLGHLDDEAAKYVNGTQQVIMLDLERHESSPEEILSSLLHELAHAYLESTGTNEDLDYRQEEELVESFARRYEDVPARALAWLQSVVAEQPRTATRGRDSEYRDIGFTETGRWGNQGSGCLFTTGDRILLLRRSMDVEEPGTWGLPGGAIPEEAGQPMDPLKSAINEAREELSAVPPHQVVDQVVYREQGFRYTTFICSVDESAQDLEFRMNWENDDWRWVGREELAELDLYFGVEFVLNKTEVFD